MNLNSALRVIEYSSTRTCVCRMSWWDYGYQITAIANRTVLVDKNTWNNTQISRVARHPSDELDQRPRVRDNARARCRLRAGHLRRLHGLLLGPYDAFRLGASHLLRLPNYSSTCSWCRHQQVPVDGAHWREQGPRTPHQGARQLHEGGRVPRRQGRLAHAAQLHHVQDELLRYIIYEYCSTRSAFQGRSQVTIGGGPAGAI